MTLNELTLALCEAGVCEAEREAYLILEHLFGISYASAVLNREKEYDAEKIEPIIKKRKEKIPLQYIFGEWYFMAERFLVTPDCLIPRSDTEILAETAIRSIRHGARIADLCTGSGCIGISLLLARPDISSLTLVDISKKALDVAESNAVLHNVSYKCSFVNEDVTNDVLCGTYGAILTNPPYILSKDMGALSDEVKKEPHIALDGGEDVLDIIRPIVFNSSAHLEDGGNLMIEFGYDQEKSISELMDDAIGRGLYSSYKIIYDYGGNPRVCFIVK